jgi:hypothetical protein
MLVSIDGIQQVSQCLLLSSNEHLVHQRLLLCKRRLVAVALYALFVQLVPAPFADTPSELYRQLIGKSYQDSSN